MFPEEVITRNVVIGPAYDLTTNDAYSIRVFIEPSRILVRNGTPVLPKLQTYTTKTGEQLKVSLPVSDQDGYADSQGRPINVSQGEYTHYYKISTFYLRNGSVVQKGAEAKVALPSDDLSDVDIDTLITFPTGRPAEVISVPDSWSAIVNEAKDLAENIPSTVDDTMDQWLEDHDLPAVRTNLNTLGWPQFIILEHDADSSNIPDGSFIVRLPEGWTPQ